MHSAKVWWGAPKGTAEEPCVLMGQAVSILLWLERVELAWPHELLLLGVASLLGEQFPFQAFS